jgi:hypothetical protein
VGGGGRGCRGSGERSRDIRVEALIRAVCRDLRGPAEIPDLLSCDGGFLRSCSDYSTLKMEAIYSSEMSVDFQWTTWRYIPEESNIRNDRCENIKSYTVN